MIGQAVGRYIIRSKLAEGGMGAVYLAEHERLPAKVVVKVLLPEYARNEILRQRFEREAMVASRLKHTNLIKIDDFGFLPDGQMFLVMPFLDGRPLDVHIAQNGALTLQHTFHIVVQLCRALHHLHKYGIVHRDLKPGNAFIVQGDDNPYQVILIDLGIARNIAEEATSKKTQAGSAMGTPGYMPPEQMGDAASATPAADLYALAVITWEMLTGQTPWGIHDPRVLYHLQMTERPEPPIGHSIPDDVLALLRKTLSVDPSERPVSARAFAIAFASMVPPIPPYVPGGAEVIARYAPELVRGAGPDLETVRSSSKADYASPATPLAWPYRSTQVPMLPQETPVAAISVGAPAAISVSSPATPVQPPTVPARPPVDALRVAAVPPATTLGAASGVIAAVSPTAATRTPRIRGVAVAALTALVAVVIVVVTINARSAGTSADPTPAAIVEPASAPTPSAAPRTSEPMSTTTSVGTPPPSTTTAVATPPPPASTTTAAATSSPPASPEASSPTPSTVPPTQIDGSSARPARVAAPAPVVRRSPPPAKDVSTPTRPGRRSVPALDPKTKAAATTVPQAGKGSGTAAPVRDERFDPNAIVE